MEKFFRSIGSTSVWTLLLILALPSVWKRSKNLRFTSVLVLVIAVVLAVFYYPSLAHKYSPKIIRTEWNIIMVSDMDKESKEPEKGHWFSHFQLGSLNRNSNGSFSLQFTRQMNVTSQHSFKDRSMELSEVIYWNNKLYAVCDSTGLLYEVDVNRGKSYARHVLVDGDDYQDKMFKAEWMTIKDNNLVIGSIGKEWITPTGANIHSNAEFIKIISPEGSIKSVNWTSNYYALRRVAGAEFPGYLIHEAAAWNEDQRSWYFLPRKRSVIPYTEKDDERQSANILLIANEDFTKIEKMTIGELDVLYGFTSLKFIPGTDLMIATRVKEHDGDLESYVGVFDKEGKFYSEPQWIQISTDYKYEGIEVI